MRGVMVGIPSHACGRLDLSGPAKHHAPLVLLSNAQLLKEEELGHLTSDRQRGGDGTRGDKQHVSGRVGIPSHACGLDLAGPAKHHAAFGFARQKKDAVVRREVHPNTGQSVHEKVEQVEAHDGESSKWIH